MECQRREELSTKMLKVNKTLVTKICSYISTSWRDFCTYQEAQLARGDL